MSQTDEYCRRCRAPLPAGARYCPACGVGITAAVTGEYEIYDVDRFFTYALDLLCIAGTDGFFKRVNPAFEHTLGWTAEELLAMPFVDLIHPEDRSETVAEVGKLASGAPTLSFENRYRCKDGTFKDLQWTSYPEPGTGLLYAVARDVTEHKRRQNRIDVQTGLASRRVFDDVLPKEWNRARRITVPVTLALFDLDHFQLFNERYGFGAGDTALARVAALLTERAQRAGDLAARVGGQEFALIMHGHFTNARAALVCEEIRTGVEALGIPHNGSSHNGVLTLSAGVAAMVPQEGQTHHTIFSASQKGLAQAKERGRNCVVQAVVE